jgi:hypothetical protein
MKRADGGADIFTRHENINTRVFSTTMTEPPFDQRPGIDGSAMKGIIVACLMMVLIIGAFVWWLW